MYLFAFLGFFSFIYCCSSFDDGSNKMKCQNCKHCVEIVNGAYVCDLHQKRIALNGENKRNWIAEPCADLVSANAKNEQPKKVWVQGRGISCTFRNILFALLFCVALGLLEFLCLFLILNYYLKGGEIWLWNF